MKRFLAMSAALTAACAAVALVANAETEKSYDFTRFDELDTAAGVEVIYETGSAYSVVAHVRHGDPDDLKMRVEDGRLYISRKSKISWGHDDLRVTVHVTSPELNAIEASSGSSVEASGIHADLFSLRVSSGASVDASGTCSQIEAKASSGGSADARELKCERAKATASSGGSVDAFASVEATSKTSSGGSVDIWGDPANREANDSISGGSTRFH